MKVVWSTKSSVTGKVERRAARANFLGQDRLKVGSREVRSVRRTWSGRCW
jgi:hypothetical protein